MSTTVLSEMISIMTDLLSLEKIVLFGSYAHKKQTPDSDLDFLIITKDPIANNKDRRDMISKLRRVLSKFRIPKDFLVYDRVEVDKWKSTTNHIISRAIKEGKVLYERS